MKITYIGHSGFWVEMERSVLLFDYYEGELPSVPAGKKLYVFSSHVHADHFNPFIFEIKAETPPSYLLSFDIEGNEKAPAAGEYLHYLQAEQVYRVNELEICTLKSTDEGVAFLVTAEGKKIYHAGDLHDWQWEEEGEPWNTDIRRAYRKFTEPLRGMKIDIGFVVLDPRQGKQYEDGLRYYLALTDTKTVFPMHFWKDYSVIQKWLRAYPETASVVRKIEAEGENFVLE